MPDTTGEDATEFRAKNITLDEDGVLLDGFRIPGKIIGLPVHIHWGGDNKTGPAITLTLHADTLTFTEEARQHIEQLGGNERVTESGTPQPK